VASASASSSSGPSALRGILPKVGISLALAALFAWIMAKGGVPLVPPAEAWGRVAWWAVPAYLALLLAMHFFRASRWRFLIAPVKDDIPFGEVILLNWIGFFAIWAFPFRLGELARPVLTKLRHGVSISAGLGTVAVERVVDGLVTSVCVIVGLFMIPRLPATDALTRSLPVYGGIFCAIFLAAFAGLVLFLWQRALAIRVIHLTFGLLSRRLAEKVAEKVDEVALGLRSLSRPRLAVGFALESLLYWAVNAAGMWVLALGCGLDVSFAQATGIMGILAIGILLPAGPGLFGSFQLSISLALRLYFAAELVGTAGAAYIFLLYGLQSLLLTLTGVVPLYMLNLRFSDLLRRG
jgi:uncharacterized protein (TIRG00374 family)